MMASSPVDLYGCEPIGLLRRRCGLYEGCEFGWFVEVREEVLLEDRGEVGFLAVAGGRGEAVRSGLGEAGAPGVAPALVVPVPVVVPVVVVTATGGTAAVPG